MIDTDSSDTDEDNKNQTLQKSTPKGSVNDVSNDYIISNPKSGQNGSLDNISLISSGSPKPSRTSSNASTKLFNRNEISSISNFSSDGISNDDFRADSEHMKRLQLYVFVSRCIAYPFNAKQSTDMARRASKVTKQNLTTIKDRFTSFLDGKTNIIADEAFRIAVQSYYDSFLCCDRVHKMVNSGGYSANDFREIFKANITKRVRSIPDIQGLSKETVLSSWMAKFDAIYRGDEDQKRTPARLAATAASELILSKEQLYEMFQTVLGVKKYEHQILFNACQLDNSDEQAAWIRRELNSRQKILSTLSKETMPKFIHKNMEEIYIEEQKAMVKSLMSIHLDGFPPTKSGSEGKSGFPKMKRGQNNVISMMDVNDDNEVLIKAVSGLSFKLQVTVMEASGLSSIRQNRIIFVVMELEGDSKLQTDQAEAGAPFLLKIIYTFRLEKFGSYIHTHPNFFLKDFLLYIIERWETQGDWTTNQPLPILKLRLMAEQSSKLMLSDDKELACVSQYKFVLCSYRPKKQSPREVMGVESYTVNFTEKTEEELEGGRFFFNIVKAGDEVLFAADENADRVNWVYNLCNATGQSFKPSFPKPPSGADRVIQKIRGDMDRALKHGLGDIVQANPFEFDQAEMFAMLQRLTLLHRLNDSYTCLGWFSPGQLFVLDEYCARYGVRGCHRHLCYLADLLERAENGTMIDPTLFHYSYAFCASHVVGNRPDGVNTVTVDEKERFDEMKNRLKSYLANQITHFRYCFPFGRPEGALKSTLTIFERVLSKDTMMPSADPEDSEDVKQAIRDCLRRAALVNYTRLSSYAKVEVYSFSPKNKWALSMHDSFQGNVSPQEKLGIIIQLAELCIELIQQNEEHHSEALAWYHELMTEHTEIFWSLFAVDMDEALDSQPPDTWDSFALFQMLNNYLRMESSLRGGKFHTHLMEKFSPSIVRYIDLMESSIARSVDKGFAKETYQSVGHGCATSEEVFWKLSSIQAFIQDLHWPDEIFAEHIATRLKRMAADMTEAIVNRVSNDIRRHLVGKVNLEYVIPVEVCVMINVLCRADEQADELCTVEDLSYPEEISYHTNIKDFIHKAQMDSIALIIDKLCSIMKELLKKLARYDQGKLSSKILNLMKPTEDVAEDFYHFVVRNIRELRKTVECESYVFTLEKALWEKLCSLLCSWLVQRQEVALHVYQFKVLSNIVEPCRKLFEQEGLTQNDLENDDYKAAYSKLQLEEAMLNLTEPTILTREIEVKSYESKIQKGDSDYEDD